MPLSPSSTEIDTSRSSSPRPSPDGEGVASASGFERILEPGRNCWRIDTAHRASLLIDGATYFRRLDEALRKARHSILIIGWDFDASAQLRPDKEDGETLGTLLRSLVEEKETLQVQILIWNLSPVHTPSATLPLIVGADWEEHPRIALHLDNHHPAYGVQHRKIVVIDGVLAFVGGIDLTINRWDTSRHQPQDPARQTVNGDSYDPIHDMEMMVDGAVARSMADLARDHWEAATEEKAAIPSAEGPQGGGEGEAEDLWPEDLEPDFSDIDIGIARTVPAIDKDREVREIESLTFDALRAARNTIYIENQYLSDDKVGDILEERLAEKDGPEVVAVITRANQGVIEGWFMGGNLNRMIRRLRQCDRYGRFGIYHPVASVDPHLEIMVHAKVLIIDDQLLRVGSSNLNRRSTGLDKECDLAIEAHDEDCQAIIRKLRNRLLSEHLDCTPDTLAQVSAEEDTLVKVIDRLNTSNKRLIDFPEVKTHGAKKLMPGTRLFDPRGPIALFGRIRRKGGPHRRRKTG